MSKVDVVQRTGAAPPAAATATAPPAIPSSLGSAMAAAAAVATAATTTTGTGTRTATGTATGIGTGIGTGTAFTATTSTPTTVNSAISARPLATSSAAITTPMTGGSHQPASLTPSLLGTTHAKSATTTTTTTTASASASAHAQTRTNGTKRRSSDHRDGRIAKSRQRPVFLKNSMEPPVLSFYGTQPVPLPSRFASLKKRLVAGHEAALEASWGRLIRALRDEIKYIDEHRTELIPSIDFTDISDTAKVEPFEASLKRHGIGVIRGVVPPEDASSWVEETKKYLETKHDFKPPPAQDPTCFDFFWTPAQVRSRAHPNMLRAQRFAMSLWNCNDDDKLTTRFPITYADRIRIESTNNGVVMVNGVAAAPVSPEDSLIAAAAAASNASIAQVDNGSLERWELDGYGRCGLYDEIFKGNWEAYNAWDPAGRINATSDLYNGAGACSMMRMFQGILALTVVEPGMIRLLPSSKLSTVYFLLRPFFAPKEAMPEPGDDDADSAEKWERYLDPANWALEKEQSTIIHGAVPGHAQRVTAAWHPHLQLDKSLVTPPTLQAGDYIVWHPDQAYQFSNTNYRSSAQPDDGKPGDGASHTSMLVYSPAAPLTQTNALFLARQRKAFLRGHPGPDFDSTGTGLGSEAPHTGRLGEKEIREVGGEEGLRAMGLAPWTLGPGKAAVATAAAADETPKSGGSPMAEEDKKDVDVEMDDGTTDTPPSGSVSSAGASRAESEVVRLANIILFPDRYDFYMPTRASSPVPTSREREKEKEKEGGEEKKKGKEKERGVSAPTSSSSSSSMARAKRDERTR